MKKFILTILIAVGLITATFAQDAYIGEIKLFAGSYPPRDWAFCNGQILQVSQFNALFSVLGTTYGGNGLQTFALPDLRGRVPVHSGYSQGPGLQPVNLGETGGVENSTIQPTNISIKAAGTSLDTRMTGRDGAPWVVQSISVVNNTPAQVITNRPPYIGLNYIICIRGLYPSRD
jgi:microcystin-dependent protein